MTFTDRIRPAAVAGTFYPEDSHALRHMIDQQLAYARSRLTDDALARLPQGIPKAVIVPHAGYVYSGTTAALAYALLGRGRGVIRRAVIIGPTHRVPVRGVAMCRATAFATPLGVSPIDVAEEARAFGMDDGLAQRPAAWRNDMRASADAPAPALMVNDPTHAREHAVEVQIPFLQTVLGPDVDIVPLNAGDATPQDVGDVLRALWGGPETVIVISSDLSHYHPNAYARMLDDETIARIAAIDPPIHPNRACGAYPVNGLLDVCRNGLGKTTADAAISLDMRFLGCCTSGDHGEVALADALIGSEPNRSAHATRPAMTNPDEAVVGYASFAVWQCETTDARPVGSASAAAHVPSSDGSNAGACTTDATDSDTRNSDHNAVRHDSPHGPDTDKGPVLLGLARTAIRRYLGLDHADGSLQTMFDRHPWLREPGASFVTLTEAGRLRGCIGTLEAYRPLGRDVADHAVDAASRDPRFAPVSAAEYPLLDVEVSVLSKPEPLNVASRAALESALRPGTDGLIIEAAGGRRATFLPQVWDELPEPHDFVGHLLAKAGLPVGLSWDDGRIRCSRYTVTAYSETPA